MDILPSEQFRKNLADNLRITKKTDRQKARKDLEKIKKTAPYQISKGLQRQIDIDIAPFDSKKFDEKLTTEEVRVGPYSNEPSLFETFEYIKNAEGAGLGVGLDQMLDIAVNTRLSAVYITDIAQKSVLTTRALLEVGRIFHALNKRYPSPAEYVALFDHDQIQLMFEMMSPSFTDEEWDIVEGVIGKFFKNERLVMHEYLNYKATQPYYQSWLSTIQNLEKIIRMYEEGHLKVVRGDIAGNQSMSLITEELHQRNTPISVFYLSNVTEFFMLEERALSLPSKKMQSLESFFENIALLPISDRAVVLQTASLRGINIVAPIPQLVQQNKNLAVMFGEWTYLVQSMNGYRRFMKNVTENPAVDPRRIILESVQGKDHTLQCYKPGVLLLDM